MKIARFFLIFLIIGFAKAQNNGNQKMNDKSFKLESAPKLGEHTNTLLNELDYSKEEIIALFRAKIIG